MAIEFELDYSHIMSDNIGAEHGLRQEDIEALQPVLDRITKQIEADIDDKNRHRQLGFWDLPHTMRGELDAMLAAAEEFRQLGDAHLILGIGGSYLGARMLFEALCHTFHNELPAARRGNWPRIYFEGNGVDNDSFHDLIDRLSGEDLTCHVVSKSGGTLETGLAFRLVRQRLGDQVKGWAVTTEHGKRLLAVCEQLELARLKFFELPRNVGGRFSVLTSVGLFPAAMMGLDVGKLLDGAHQMRDHCLNNTLVWKNPAFLYAALQHLSLLSGRNISVMSVWTKALEAFGLWYDQLSAESLGKDSRGRTPITAVCTRELHSRGQQHQEGTRDKVICNLVVRDPRRDPLAADPDPGDDAERAMYANRDAYDKAQRKRIEAEADGFFYAAGQPLHNISEFAYMATDTAYAKVQRPGMTMAIGKLDEEHLGALIFLFELATLVEGRLMAVDPLDQPGVQAYKDFLTGLLGKPGLENFRDECLALRAATKPFECRV